MAPRATVTRTEEAREQARRLQQESPTFSEALLSIEWALAQNPLRGDRTNEAGLYAYERGAAAGSPGIRVTYRYRREEVVIVAVELVD